MKQSFKKGAGLVLALAFVLNACSQGGNGTSPSGTTNGSSAPGQSSSNNGSSSAYGKTSVPGNTVDFQAGNVYQVGQAIKDAKSGIIIEVTGVRYDTSLPGLDANQTYALIDITLGNTGTQTYSTSSLGSFVVFAKGSGASYEEGHLIDLLAAKILNPDDQLDQDIAPGTAFHGLLPVALPSSETGLELHFNSLNSDSSMGPTMIIALGK